MNFHLSAFEFIELLPDGSLKSGRDHQNTEGREGDGGLFYFTCNNILSFHKVTLMCKLGLGQVRTKSQELNQALPRVW